MERALDGRLLCMSLNTGWSAALYVIEHWMVGCFVCHSVMIKIVGHIKFSCKLLNLQIFLLPRFVQHKLK